MSAPSVVRRLLIANRGEIAVRIARTARQLGIATVAVFSDADAEAPHVRAADAALRIGPAPAAASYANAAAILEAARRAGANAVHPGYGFLAEDAAFAEACREAGLVFIGPSPAAMRAVGDKATAKRLLAGGPVPLLAGYDGSDQSDRALHDAARALGAPLMIKASAGGGGRGMRLVTTPEAFAAALAAARSEALATFGSADVLLERALLAPRHLEVQIAADRYGNVVSLGERDCSVQRRHQKVIEEAPSPSAGEPLRGALAEAAIAVARAAAYDSLGTVEFLVDRDGGFFFIEMNARLQVEHPVTEAVSGLDLVEWQIRVAQSEPLPLPQEAIRLAGHAIEARLCAEDPADQFLPQTGRLARWEPPAGVRVEHALASGIEISPFYDSMIAKIVASGPTREVARVRLVAALRETVALGVTTNRDALIETLEDERFVRGEATTAFFDVAPTPEPVSEQELVITAGMLYRASIGSDDAADGFGDFAGWSTTEHPGTVFDLGAAPGPLLVRGSRSRMRVRHGEREYDLAIEPRDGPDAPRDDDVSQAGPERSERLRVAVDAEPSHRLSYAVAASRIDVVSGARSWHVRDRTGEAASSASRARLDGMLRAPMSGRIARIAAAPGARVDAGDVLIVLEAMKMEHHLTLAAAVVAGEPFVLTGAQVGAGDPLMAYEVAAP